MDQVGIAQLRQEFPHGELALGHARKRHGAFLRIGVHHRKALPAAHGGDYCLLGARGQPLQRVFVGIHRLPRAQRLVAAVCQQALFKPRGRQAVTHRAHNGCFGLLVGIAELFCIAYRCAEVKRVPPLLQHKRAAAELARIVEARHLRRLKAQRQHFAFAGGQQLCFLEGGKASGGLLQQPLRRAVVQLHHLFAGAAAGVRHAHTHADLSVPFAGHQRHCLEFGVGKAVPERVHHLFIRAGQRFKVAVAHIDILGICHVVRRIEEPLRGGVIAQIARKGIRQLAAGVCSAGEQRRNGAAALHARLICQQHRRDARIRAKPRNIHHAAHVEHQHHLLERGTHLLDERALGLGAVKIAFAKNARGNLRHCQLVLPGVRLVLVDVFVVAAVPPLAGKTAEHNNRDIRRRARLPHKLCGQLRLGHQAWGVAGGVALGHIAAVKI